MPVELLTENFTPVFRRRVKTAVKVQIASAWLTESGTLNAMLERKALCELQAIIGISGNATSPDGLSSLAQGFGWESVRLADDRCLFHPKLVLFHYPRTPTLAWIGSANFTGNGMCVNTELMLETDDERTVEKMEDWFDREWESRPSDAKRLFEAYRKRHKRPHPNEGDLGGAPDTYRALRDHLLVALGADVQENRTQQYVAFKRQHNFACVPNPQQKSAIAIELFNVDPDTIDLEKGFCRRKKRSVAKRGPCVEVTIHSREDLRRAEPLLKKSYDATS